MKAAQINTYGGNEVIEVSENAPKPPLKKEQILVGNYSASINAIDWKIRAGYLQKMAPLPFPITLGGDFAGVVIEIADGVTQYKVGDLVYGQAIILNGGSGSMAQYVAANTKNTALIPKTSPVGEAGTLPLVGTSVIQAIEEHVSLQKGQKILIHGGAGGIGHLAIQLAKARGAYVITTVGMKDKNFVRELGADEVIDYKKDKFEEVVKEVDAVFDTVGGEVMDKSFAVLKKGGILVTMVGKPNEDLAKKYEVTAIGQFTKTDSATLNRLSTLVDSGKLKVHVDRVFPLTQAKEAFIYQQEVHPQGKVVLQIKQ